ncbi:regulatory LacI family protein [Kineothrix alysoides]|uniref:Regulatory LacI family protein n=1 Tax=Kineothrix alysoides TaxID=1469948 RepID=A0A4R1QSN6_9FIRM|nr:LacI family DNA-binding transcriptional regulator [Kineothrix alysoides]TCL55475.1 regulatory LacI family protein [Kineothrix alysoides]
MKNKITIRDVAREADVSIATVSYVLNGRTDMRISEQTRKKVLQVINLLDYTPNQSAQALATNRNRMIALYLTPDASVLNKAEQMCFIHLLSSFLHEKNYDLIYLSDNYTEQFDNADAIIGYDISAEYFHQIGDVNFSPLLAVHCFIEDPLFFQINSDYARIAGEASLFFQGEPYTLYSLKTPNIQKQQYLEKNFSKVHYVEDFHDLDNTDGENILVMDQTLQELLKNHPSLYYVPSMSAEKAEALITCVEYALLRTPLKQHNILI